MSKNFLEFEKPIAELQAKIEELRNVSGGDTINISQEINRLEKKCEQLTKNIFANLSPWQITQIARHPNRPQPLDYINNIFEDFNELHGDRHFSNAPEIVTGLARIGSINVAVIGHQKGKNTAEKVKRNFGMAMPESYRKALRVLKLAEKFNLPVITFIDTAGAYAGIEAEERNQSEAIARNLFEMAELKTPIISLVSGEGGSGGALAIGIADRLLMLQYSVYSVITPEGCASILWKDAAKAEIAASAMGMTANSLHELGLIDKIIQEPMGGAHRNPEELMSLLKVELISMLSELKAVNIEKLLYERNEKIMQYGIS